MNANWPVEIDEVRRAAKRLSKFLSPTPLRHYHEVDHLLGGDIDVWLKHENHQPTQAFKIRNALSLLTAMGSEQRQMGIVAATRGNHGLGLALAGQVLDVPVVICVPHGNNPEKNAAIRALGAELIESGEDYDDSLAVAHQLVDERGMHMAHSTNNAHIIAGAGTITLEMLEQAKQAGVELDALVVSVGGGSQAVGALTAVRALNPSMEVYGVQAEGASAICDSWHAGKPLHYDSAKTIADGLATRSTYEMTFPALQQGLSDFIKVSDAQIAAAVRDLIRTTHNLVEPAGAAGMAGLCALAERLRGKRVGVILSGGNIDQDTLRAILNKEI